MSKLSQPEIEQALSRVPGWTLEGNHIRRTYTLPSFPESMLYAGMVAQLAQQADHHPDILIQYDKVTLTLSTHTAGGLTEKDFALAQRIDAMGAP